MRWLTLTMISVAYMAMATQIAYGSQTQTQTQTQTENESSQQHIPRGEQLAVLFNAEAYEFNDTERSVIEGIIRRTTQEVRHLLPSLNGPIEVMVNSIDRNLDIVGGVFGRAEAPGKVSVFLSTASQGGVLGAARSALKSSLYHEYHHLSVGWTMTQNRYGNPSGIPVAVVNEGLASVFAETYTEQYFAKANDYPEDVAKWLPEIMALPLNANYSHWVSGFHPDGRSVIGYRLGRYVIHQAQKSTGKNILQLSQLHPNEILNVVNGD